MVEPGTSTCNPKESNDWRPSMKIIIVGCGRVGSALAYQLSKKGHQVTVIDQNASTFDNLPLDFEGRTIEGDVLARNVLHRAEVESADGLVAVTRSDSLNALVAHIAQTDYNISKVVARNYDPRQQPIQEAFGIPIVGPIGWRVQRFEELLSDNLLQTIFLDNKNNVGFYQLKVPEVWHGRSLQELLTEERGKVIAWRRGDQSVPVSSAKSIETGDLIYLMADSKEFQALQSYLAKQWERQV